MSQFYTYLGKQQMNNIKIKLFWLLVKNNSCDVHNSNFFLLDTNKMDAFSKSQNCIKKEVMVSILSIYEGSWKVTVLIIYDLLIVEYF